MKKCLLKFRSVLDANEYYPGFHGEEYNDISRIIIGIDYDTEKECDLHLDLLLRETVYYKLRQLYNRIDAADLLSLCYITYPKFNFNCIKKKKRLWSKYPNFPYQIIHDDEEIDMNGEVTYYGFAKIDKMDYSAAKPFGFDFILPSDKINQMDIQKIFSDQRTYNKEILKQVAQLNGIYFDCVMGKMDGASVHCYMNTNVYDKIIPYLDQWIQTEIF